MLTGSRLEAAVEGLMSRCGSGWRLIEIDWSVDVTSATPWVSAMARDKESRQARSESVANVKLMWVESEVPGARRGFRDRDLILSDP